MDCTPVVVKNDDMYDCAGWVKVRHFLFSWRRVWYMRLMGSTITLHDKFDGPTCLEYSLALCNVRHNLMSPKSFAITLSSGLKLRISCDSRRDAIKWKRAIRRASRIALKNDYEVLEEVQEEGARTVFNAIDKFDGSPVLVHRIAKDAEAAPDFCRLQALGRELYATRNLGHQNLQWAYATFNEPGYAYIVTRRASGKRMVDIIKEQNGSLPECVVRAVTKKVIEALMSMHMRGYAHRNVTLNSIWCDETADDDLCVILSNFENVGFVDDVEDLRLKGEIGDAMHVAPEMMHGRCYSASVDLFSLGVCVYRLLSGSYPYEINTQRRSKTVENRQREVNLDGEVWEQVSEEGRNFVKALLQPDWLKRLNAMEAIEHPWFEAKLPQLKQECHSGKVRCTQNEVTREKDGAEPTKLYAETERQERVSGVKDIERLLKKDEALLSPFMKRLLSPLSDAAPLSAKSAVDAFARSLDHPKFVA